MYHACRFRNILDLLSRGELEVEPRCWVCSSCGGIVLHIQEIETAMAGIS